MYPWSQLAEQQPFSLDSPLCLPRLHVLLSGCHGLQFLFPTMFCSLLKSNHSTTVFIARRAEINLFISLCLTNKPLTHRAHFYRCLQLSEQTSILFYGSAHVQSKISQNTNTQTVEKTEPNKKETKDIQLQVYISHGISVPLIITEVIVMW